MLTNSKIALSLALVLATAMRLALITLVTAAGLTADIRTASAQAADSFFQERYCARRANGRLSCNYKTLEQCNFTTDPGAVRYCIESPWWHGPRGQPTTQHNHQ